MDLLIVDEAHNLAPAAFGRDSDVSKMLQQIAPWFEHRLFLTATPHNGHTRSFSGLLEALDPVRFTRKIELDDEDRRRVSETVIRRLKSEINASYTASNEPARFSERHVTALPKLSFTTAEHALHAALTDFRKALKVVAEDSSHEDRTAAAFAAEVLRKRLISGPWAFGQSWLSLMEGIKDEADEGTATAVSRVRDAVAGDTDDDLERETRQRHADKTVGTWLRKWKTALAEPIRTLTKAVEAVGVSHVPAELDPTARRQEVAARALDVTADARLTTLETLLDEQLREGDEWRSDERIVVFSEYLATLEYLTARLRERYGDGPWLLQMYGGMNDTERDAVKHAFNDPQGPARVLIATDAAGEGLNLQRAARTMLHWDIPWNPSRMEQRNGRLDRHGQKRDVFIYHFDSDDDAFLGFMGRVLRKRSQTREDRVVTDEIFSDAILAYFQLNDDVEKIDTLLDDAIKQAKAANAEVAEDLPSAAPLPGAEDQARLEALKAELDLDPATLRETLETAMAIEAGRPRLQADGQGRDRLVYPVPALWQELVDATLRQGGPTGPMLSLVFDPAHFVETHDGTPAGRPVYTPEPDARLLHLGDMLYHRVMSTFARYRFPGGPAAATRWTVRSGNVPTGTDALVLLTIEELAVNDLREPCHHWVRTIAFPVRDGKLGPPQPHQAARDLRGEPTAGDRDAARDIWDDIDGDLKQHVKALTAQLSAALTARMQAAGLAVREIEQKRFARRRKELEKAIGDNQLARLSKEAAKLREKVQQLALFAEIDRDLQNRLTDLEAELALRRSHYETVQQRLKVEEKRTLEDVLPARYALRGDAQVYPISVEIRLPGGAA